MVYFPTNSSVFPHTVKHLVCSKLSQKSGINFPNNLYSVEYLFFMSFSWMTENDVFLELSKIPGSKKRIVLYITSCSSIFNCVY